MRKKGETLTKYINAEETAYRKLQRVLKEAMEGGQDEHSDDDQPPPTVKKLQLPKMVLPNLVQVQMPKKCCQNSDKIHMPIITILLQILQ